MTPVPSPIEQFIRWQNRAEGRGVVERTRSLLWRTLLGEDPRPAGAAALATADGSGHPSARMILIKGVSERGFRFFTNYSSRKAGELDVNPEASLLFYWPHVARQVRVEGTVLRLSAEESDAYFASRPRGSQLGAWASRQSGRLPNPEVLTARVRKFQTRFADAEVPRPPFWGGYLLTPRVLEFWQARPDRLHRRQCFAREGDHWRTFELMP